MSQQSSTFSLDGSEEISQLGKLISTLRGEVAALPTDKRGFVDELLDELAKTRDEIAILAPKAVARLKAQKESNAKQFEEIQQRLTAKKDFLENKRLELTELLEKAERDTEAASKLPKPEIKKPRKLKWSTGDPIKLLSAEELRQQIIKKAETPPPPPRTSGNIWEGWQIPHNKSDDELDEMDL